MAPMPVYTIFDRDHALQIALVDSDDTVAVVAEKAAANSVNRRVAPQDRPLTVRYDGRLLDPGLTATEAGIAPLSTIYLAYQDA